MLTEFGIVLLFIILGLVFVAIGLLTAAIVRPSNPNPLKNSTYECGEEPIGFPWIRFNVRFYTVALVFLLFDVELVLLFPWAVVFQDLGWFSFLAMTVFVIILLVGLAYDWAKGYIDWEKPEPIIPKLNDLVIPRKNREK